MAELTLGLQAADAEWVVQGEESRRIGGLLLVASTALLHWQAAGVSEDTPALGHSWPGRNHRLRAARPAAERHSRRKASTSVVSMGVDAADG